MRRSVVELELPTSSTSCETEVAMGGAHSSENRWTLGFQGVRVANPAPVSAALVDPQPGGQTISNESRGAAGYKQPRIVEFGTPYKKPMSSSGRQSVDLMMMMF
ncbi:jg3622 [Pararge aegeria aegeria]|uniref:Jg3622 protein n=1 Tax=Pararge aegeria aegeria TaxID=348720 RepID=A0A8S4RA11_9NEOP|nr:jg3622 [Pararge aegeria aegeria]